MTVFAELNPPYSTIVADPPWRFGSGYPPKADDGYKVRDLTYSSLTLDEIRSLPVGDLATDTRLFLWVTNHHLRHGWSVLEAWGFTPQQRLLVWCKTPRCTAPVTTEFILIGKRGKPPAMPWLNTTWFNWPLQPLHSQKPDAFIDLVESWCPGPYVELFCRRPRFGWDSWGYGYEAAS